VLNEGRGCLVGCGLSSFDLGGYGGVCATGFCGSGLCCRKGWTGQVGCGSAGCDSGHCCTDVLPSPLPPPLPPLPPSPPTPPVSPPPPPFAPWVGMLHTLLDSSCTSQPALDEYAQEHGQAFLDGDLLADIVNGSLDLPRTTLADGIPNGVVDLGLEAAGVSGWQATLLRGVLLPVVRPYLGDGIDNIAIEGLECGDFSLRRVESEYCLPFRIGGWVHGLGVVCRGTCVLSLSWSSVSSHLWL